MSRQGAALGRCTTTRVSGGIQLHHAPPRAGRRLAQKRLFYSNCHPTAVTAAAKCFQLPHEMAQGKVPSSPPPCPRDKPQWAAVGSGAAPILWHGGSHCTTRCRAPPAPLLQPGSSSRGAAAPSRRLQLPSPVPCAHCLAPLPRAPQAPQAQPGLLPSPGPTPWDGRALLQLRQNPPPGSLLPPICPSLFSLFSVYELGEY